MIDIDSLRGSKIEKANYFTSNTISSTETSAWTYTGNCGSTYKYTVNSTDIFGGVNNFGTGC
jgi:hypothetical protein